MGTTLVTGVGLVGTSFAQCALKRNEKLVFYDFMPRTEYLHRKLGTADVEVVQKDIRDLPALTEAMQRYRPETVVHTAGLIGGRVEESLYSGLQINVMGTINVLEAARLTGVKRFVLISTFGAYDRRRAGDQPTHEDMPRGPGAGYGNSKATKELMAEAYQRLYGFELLTLRLANAYGLGHFWGGSGGGEKVQMLLEAGIRGEVARIPQAQTMTFEYVYAKDMGRAVDLATTVAMPEKTTFNIGVGQLTTFDELVAAAERQFPKLEVEVIPGSPPAVSASSPLDISRAKEYLGWEPQYSMDAAFEDYVKDLRAVME
ncbi:MAG: NAD(P)-dependent oxidoreductase [Deltaproteobacteria bacterium]|nr:NAD(P)-dependent oxidoreductase [Deltaproteobacteria bacterium]